MKVKSPKGGTRYVDAKKGLTLMPDGRLTAVSPRKGKGKK